MNATCLAIAAADKRGTLRLIERTGRLGDTFIAITDECGIIEVAEDRATARKRIDQLRIRSARN